MTYDPDNLTEGGSINELTKLVKENNRMLKKLHRAQMWSSVMRAVYWVLILGITVGAYYYLQPIVNDLLNTLQSILGTVGKVQNVGNQLPGLEGALDLFSNLNGATAN